MIARIPADDPRIELAAEAHWNAKIALGVNVPAWRDLPDHQRHKQRVAMAAALRAVERYDAEQRRRVA